MPRVYNPASVRPQIDVDRYGDLSPGLGRVAARSQLLESRNPARILTVQRLSTQNLDMDPLMAYRRGDS